MISRSIGAKLHLAVDLPGSAPDIRRLVVGLAVAGKLDKSESRQYRELPDASTELPFEVHPSLKVCRLGDIASITKGETGIQKAKPGAYPLVTLAEERSTCQAYQFDEDAAIVPLISSTGHGHASLKRLHYQAGKFALGNILCAVVPLDKTKITARYLFEYLSTFKEELLVSQMSGTANVSLTIGKLKEVPVPILSVGTQQRIDELMTLCDQLEAAQQEREARRDRLVMASLKALVETPPQPADSPAAGKKARKPTPPSTEAIFLREISRLTTQPKHIQQLRQTILDLAVRGRLVRQEAGDEPANKLLERLAAEKRTLVTSRTATGKGSFVEPKFDIPKTWEWVVTNDVFLSIADGDHQPPPKSDKGIPFLVIGDVRSGVINYAAERFVSKEYFNKVDIRRRPQKGDLLYTLVGSYGIPIIVEEQRPFCVQRHIAILRPCKNMNVGFLRIVMGSKFVFQQATECATGIAQKTVGLSGLRTIQIPLPPLNEQHRIVAAVNKLVEVSDKLMAQIAMGQETSHKLLVALLHDALGGNGEVPA